MSTLSSGQVGSAVFSIDHIYRYVLFRRLRPEGRVVNLIGLNPSTAGENHNDATARRGIGYAKRWNASLLVMTNIFAFRATKPKDMKLAYDPIGPENDVLLRKWAVRSDIVIAAWGTHGKFKGRGAAVTKLLRDTDLFVLRLTKDGYPHHPLRLPGALDPVLWRAHD